MRQFPNRSALPAATEKRLQDETARIQAAADPKTAALKRYTAARQQAENWFKPVLDALRCLAGKGARCMYCSSSEAFQIEHFRPLSVFPELALVWLNYLWVCGLCNLWKGDQFPPEPDKLLINPLDENVWDFFSLDELGCLAAVWSEQHNGPHPRAVSTMQIIALDREDLQESRKDRYDNLREQVADSLRLFNQGTLSKTQLRARIKRWRTNAIQPDVADYFLNGPGRAEAPFAELFKLLT